MTIATYPTPQTETEEFPWSPSGLVLLELIKSEISKNGQYVYARENLNQIEFEDFTRKIYAGGGQK